MRPHLGDVEYVEPVCGGFLVGHDLHLQAPGRVVTPGDGLIEVAGGVVGVGALQRLGFLRGQVLDALLGLEVILDPVAVPGFVVPEEGVAAVPVHVPVRLGRPAIGEEDGHLMHRFGGQGEKIPEHVGVFEVRGRIALLGVDEVRELERVADEEHRGVVARHVVITVFGIELDGEPARVALGIGRAPLAPHRREAHEHLGAPADRGEELGLGVLGDVGRDLEIAVGAGPLGVDHPLGDPLPVEVGQLV